MLKNYFKIAWRNLWKNKTESFINIIGLSVGTSAAVLVGMWVQNELSFDNYHPGSDRIFLIVNHSVFGRSGYSPYPMAKAAREETPEIEDAVRLYAPTYNPPSLSIGQTQFLEKGCAYVDQGWFQMFHYDLIEGSIDDFNSHPYSLVLTESTAEKYFGSGSAVGKTIRVDSMNYQVQAIIKDNPVNSSFDFNILLPLRSKFSGVRAKEEMRNWGRAAYMTFVRLRSSATATEVGRKLATIDERNQSNIRNGDAQRISMLSLKELHFEENIASSGLSHGNRKVVYIFGIIAILLMLAASINYVNLSTARASLRIKEVSIKKIAGAGRWQLAGQFLSESVLMSLMASLLSIFLIQLTLPFLNNFTGRTFSLTTFWPWIILIGTFVGTVLLTSIYPTVLLSSFKPFGLFHNQNRVNVRGSVFRNTLVVAQFSISVVLIISTIVLFRQLYFIHNQDPGYNRAQVLSFSLPLETISTWKSEGNAFEVFCQSMKQDLLSSSAIENVSLMNGASIMDIKGEVYGLDWEGRDPDFNLPITVLNVDPDFMQIVNLNLTAGRWFTTGSKADETNVILNETAVKELKLQQPVIGRRFYAGIGVDENQVIGVVKDFHFQSLHEKVGPLVIISNPVHKNNFLIKVVPGRVTQAVQDAKKTWNNFIKEHSFSYRFLDEEFDQLYRSDRRSFILIGIFAGLVIFISCLGLFGLASFSAIRRSREIGIRKVLGASVRSVLLSLSKDFIKPVLIAILIASPVAWYIMSRWLQDFAYRIDLGWWVFALAGLLAVMIALLTVSFQSVRAALMNPVKSLRSE